MAFPAAQALIETSATLRGSGAGPVLEEPPEITKARGHLEELMAQGVDPLVARLRAGLAWIDLPEGRGGLGIDPDYQVAAERAAEELGVPRPPADATVGATMVGPALGLFGSEAQAQLLEGSFSGEIRWCQLFSEPNAGSDLASLTTRAERTERGWVVNGQKVWTSNASRATHGLLLARTGEVSERHRGLSMFIVPMDAAGLTLRPLRQMNGESRFYEVFLDDVVLEEGALLGDIARGWYIAMEVLNRERRSVHQGLIEDVLSAVDLLVAARPDDRLKADAWRRLVTSHLANTLLERRLVETGLLGESHYGPLLKVAQSQLFKAIANSAVEALGPAGQLAGYEVGGPGWEPDETSSFLRAQASSIEGGTTEILKNVIAEQGLGLPKG